MPTIRFLPADKVIEAPAGTLLADAARRAGMAVDLPCGGKGTCGKCLVRISDGIVDLKPLSVLTDEQRDAGLVPACRAFVMGDATITIPEESVCTHVSDIDDGIDFVCEQVPAVTDLSPLVQCVPIKVAGPAREDGFSDFDRLIRALTPVLQGRTPRVPLSMIRKLSDALRSRDGEVEVIAALPESAAGTGMELVVIDILPGHSSSHLLGIAVDLGTTTISVQLVDLKTGRVLSARNGYNDQIHCGLDVISRINYAAFGERLEDLRTRAVGSVNRLVAEALQDASAAGEDVFCCIVSGNTVMTHLILGLRPEYIRLDPYTPTLLRVPPLSAFDLGLCVNPNAYVRFSPCVGSYVGGDITAGMLTLGTAWDADEISLFIDIGTNGEIVLGNSDFLMTCACSAGPAFEGGGIECGMRATTGAIDRVEIDAETGTARYTTIGETRPAGICGSGLIDLVAGLFLTGWLDASGKLNRDRECKNIRINGRRAFYVIAEGDQTPAGRPIILSETDIDNLMRAKAAIYSAASLLISQAGIAFGDLGRFAVAGGFGRFLDIDHAVAIGLLPDIEREKYIYLGNASLKGSSLCLLSEEFRQRQQSLAGRMTYIDLSTFPGYMDHYTAALFLPHTDRSLFPAIHEQR